MAQRVTAPGIRAMKQRGEKVVCVTAYDVSMARIADAAGVDLVLVGDSVGNVVLGYENTIPVTLEEMLHHTRAVVRGVARALVVGDMPFGSYQPSLERAMDAATAFMKAGAHAVKIEGPYPELVREMVRAGIPVMGHLGMTPQSVNKFGGFKVQGKGDDAATLIAEARALDEAGVFALVIELVPSATARDVSKAVGCPTIGIGGGVHCDGQIQVYHDLVGLTDFKMKHAKTYVDGNQLFIDGLKRYTDEVRAGQFPGDEHSF